MFPRMQRPPAAPKQCAGETPPLSGAQPAVVPQAVGYAGDRHARRGWRCQQVAQKAVSNQAAATVAEIPEGREIKHAERARRSARPVHMAALKQVFTRMKYALVRVACRRWRAKVVAR
jgi:hypothetical protein